MTVSQAVSQILWLMFGMTSTFACVRSVNDWMIVGRWAGAAICLLPLCMWTAACARPEHTFTHASYSFAVCNLAVTVYGGLQCLGILLPDGPFRVTAGFDNPAGMAAALVATYPYLASVLPISGRKMCVYSAVFVAESALLYVAGTRAGLIALSAAFVLTVLPHLSSCGRKAVSAAVAVCLSVSLVLLFSRKTASTYGRSMILRCSLSLAMEHPFLGVGTGGFLRLYMPYQAEWLGNPAHTHLSMLADNVTHPLCEYMLILVNYGIIGLTAVLAFLTATIVRAFNRDSATCRTSVAALVSVSVLSAFSYPFRYPLTLVAVAVACLCIWRGAIGRLPAVVVRAFPPLASVAYVTVFVLLTMPWLKAQSEWKGLSDRSGQGDVPEQVLQGYAGLESRLGLDPYFLYNRAVTYHQTGRNNEALESVKSSLAKLSCYDSVLLEGDIERDLGHISEAESCYRLASCMCPCRFLPLYRLFRLYQETGRDADMRSIGRDILSKPMKVPSADVRRIRLSVRQTMAGLTTVCD